MPNDIAWRETLANWQGQINAVVKGLGKNQDDLENWALTMQKNCHECREELLIKITNLEAAAKQIGKRWGIIYGVITAILTILATKLIGL